jgi:hypothetical protein
MLNELPGALRSLRHSRRLTSQAPQCRPHLKGEIRSATAYRSQKTPGNHRFPVEVYDLPLSLIRDQREAVGPPRIHRYIIFIQDLLLSGLKLLTFFDCYLPNISDRDGGGGCSRQSTRYGILCQNTSQADIDRVSLTLGARTLGGGGALLAQRQLGRSPLR